jgi:predicted transcriptional regulator
MNRSKTEILQDILKRCGRPETRFTYIMKECRLSYYSANRYIGMLQNAGLVITNDTPKGIFYELTIKGSNAITKANELSKELEAIA